MARHGILSILAGTLLLLGLYLTSLYSYLLFHTLAEIFGVAVAWAVFMLAWNARRFMDNDFFLFLGVAYLFVGGLDLLHTLSYEGMGVFRQPGAPLATQLWITARYVTSLSWLIAPFFLGRKLNGRLLLVVYSVVVGLLLATIFHWEVFPVCYVEGVGLTPFKKGSEYVICVILAGAIVLLLRKREAFDRSVFGLLLAAIAVNIVSELAFTLYVDVFGMANLVGHYFKIVSFYFVYRAVIATGLTRPHALLFRDLKKNEMALRESEEKYRTMMEGMKSPVYICGPDFRVAYMNPAMIERVGGDFTGEPCFKVIHDQKEQCAWCVFDHVRRGNYTESRVVSPKDGRYYHVSNSPLFHGDGSVSKMTIFTDMTEQKRMEEELERQQEILEDRVRERTEALYEANRLLESEVLERRETQQALWESQRRFESLWQEAPVAYHLLDANGIICQVNQTEAKLLGYSKEEMVGRSIFDFILPEQRQEAERRFRLKIAGQQLPKDVNRIYLTKEGRNVYVTIDDVLEKDGEGKVIGVRTTMVDVTDRKEAEFALRKSEAELRRLSGQLLSVQEDERRRIARELHDSIGQSLAAVKFVAENALNQVEKGETKAGVAALGSLIPLIQEAGDEVRRIHTDLRPSLLDDLGIVSTISWFCREFEKLFDATTIRKVMEVEEADVPEPLKIVIFRVLQEALNNVVKHGEAAVANVSLRREDGMIELAVEDDGRGFDVEAIGSQKSLTGGFGLTNMKERTELSGGRFSIQSHVGGGTIVRAAWPISSPAGGTPEGKTG